MSEILMNIFLISLSMSVVILLLLLLSPIINKRYSAKWGYYIWLILAIRLIVPFKIELPQKAPVNITVPTNQTLVIQNDTNVPTVVSNFIETEVETKSYRPIISLNQLITLIWLIGSISFLLINIANYFNFKRKVKPYLEDVGFNCNTKLKVKYCSKIGSPMMIGFINPIIILPKITYSQNEIDVILKHELTHYKRLDIWYKLILIICNSIHFFNPLVYLMVKQANKDLEYSCDDVVVENSDIDFRKHYSLTILKSMKNGGV